MRLFIFRLLLSTTSFLLLSGLVDANAQMLQSSAQKIGTYKNISTQKPNIVIILADDMGFGDVTELNKMARTSTPNIDRMVQQGMTFTDAHAGGAICTPSRYGLITGRYYFRLPKRIEYLGYLQPLIETGRETIGSMMQKTGYETACVGKWHLGLNWGLKNTNAPQIPKQQPKTITNTDFHKPTSGGPTVLGFNYSFILPASLDMPPYAFVRNSNVTDPDMVLTTDKYPHSQNETRPVWDKKYTTDDDVYWERGVWWRNGEISRSFRMEDCLDTIVAQGLSFIRSHAKSKPEQPFLLYMPLTGPHTPWLPTGSYKGKSPMGTYGDFVLQIDQVVADVHKTLKSLGIDENTMVIFSSDNGAPWSEEDIQVYNHNSNEGRRGQKGDVYDGGHHIPLVVTWPAKIKKPSRFNGSVSLVDLMATFAEMTGQTITKGFGEDSFSFYKALNGVQSFTGREDILYQSSGRTLAIKADDWKYIDGLGSGGFTAPNSLDPVGGGPKGQLFNIRLDPMETQNLYLQYPDKVKELNALLHRYIEQGFTRKD